MRIATWNPKKKTVTWHDGETGDAMVRYYNVRMVSGVLGEKPTVTVTTGYGPSGITEITLKDTLMVSDVDY